MWRGATAVVCAWTGFRRLIERARKRQNILGVARYQLWKAGKLPLKNFVNCAGEPAAGLQPRRRRAQGNDGAVIMSTTMKQVFYGCAFGALGLAYVMAAHFALNKIM